MSDVTDLKAEVLLLRQENKELRDKHKELQEFAVRMAEALGIDSEWKNPYEDCKSSCKLKFGCCACRSKALCPAWARLKELGVVK